jgi:hypothetical protein
VIRTPQDTGRARAEQPRRSRLVAKAKKRVDNNFRMFERSRRKLVLTRQRQCSAFRMEPGAWLVGIGLMVTELGT